MKRVEIVEFPIAKAIREKIFKIPLLPQDKVVEKFKELDFILHPLVQELTQLFPYLRDYFQAVIFRAVSGNTMGKNYFDKEDHEDTVPSESLLKNSEHRVLMKAFPLLRLDESPAEFVEVLMKVGFLRGVFEEAIESFLAVCAEYPRIIRELKTAKEAGSDKYVELEKILGGIETELICFNTELICEKVELAKREWDKYLKLRDELISPYFRLVYTLAKATSSSDSQTLDNFQNGVFGLVRAVKCYTPSRFAAFSVVAKMWIRQSILLNLKSEMNFIKLPVAIWHVYQKLERARQVIEQKTQKDASYSQIAKATKMTVDKIKKVYENAKLCQVYSLNTPTINEEEQSVGNAKWNMESIPANESSIEQFELLSEYGLIEKVVKTFDDEERLIFGLISGCFGFLPESQFTQEELLAEKLRQLGMGFGLKLTPKKKGK